MKFVVDAQLPRQLARERATENLVYLDVLNP